jgi:hypothetical protein
MECSARIASSTASASAPKAAVTSGMPIITVLPKVASSASIPAAPSGRPPRRRAASSVPA